MCRRSALRCVPSCFSQEIWCSRVPRQGSLSVTPCSLRYKRAHACLTVCRSSAWLARARSPSVPESVEVLEQQDAHARGVQPDRPGRGGAHLCSSTAPHCVSAQISDPGRARPVPTHLSIVLRPRPMLFVCHAVLPARLTPVSVLCPSNPASDRGTWPRAPPFKTVEDRSAAHCTWVSKVQQQGQVDTTANAALTANITSSALHRQPDTNWYCRAS
jgi:hypothetical protein